MGSALLVRSETLDQKLIENSMAADRQSTGPRLENRPQFSWEAPMTGRNGLKGRLKRLFRWNSAGGVEHRGQQPNESDIRKPKAGL
jgi:hypothetical protein